MSTEQQEANKKIATWLSGDATLYQEARRIAKGVPIPPFGEVFEYRDMELFDFVFEVLFAGEYGERVFEELGIDLRYLNEIREELDEDDVYGADWELIRKTLLREI